MDRPCPQYVCVNWTGKICAEGGIYEFVCEKKNIFHLRMRLFLNSLTGQPVSHKMDDNPYDKCSGYASEEEKTRRKIRYRTGLGEKPGKILGEKYLIRMGGGSYKG